MTVLFNILYEARFIDNQLFYKIYLIGYEILHILGYSNLMPGAEHWKYQ